MRRFPVTTSASLLSLTFLCASALAQQHATMSVTVVAIGADSTRSDGESTQATFSYRAAFTIELESDGEATDINMYDPQYAEKALAAANATMAKVQAALRGEFSDEEEEEVEPDNRYLLFTGRMECPATLSIDVEERMEGEYADVSGMQPYTMTFTATSNGEKQERDMLCVAGASVLDIKDNTLYRSTIGFPEVTGHYVFNEANRGNLQDDPQARHSALPQFIANYVFDTLRVAPAQGQVKTQLKPTEPVITRINSYGGYQGSVDVEITWDFERSE